MKYNRQLMNEMADNFSNYLELVDRYLIIDGLSKEEYKQTKKEMKKLIKYLRERKGNKVFDMDKYVKYVIDGEDFDEYDDYR